MLEVESIVLGKTFVRYLPREADNEHYLGLVTGILGVLEEDFVLCLINRQGSVEVSRTLCVPVLPTSIVSGLLWFHAKESSFGCGTVIKEERKDGLLYVTLKRDEEVSGPIPITDVTFLCPCS